MHSRTTSPSGSSLIEIFSHVLKPNRINHFEKRELIEISIPGADLSNSVLTEKNGGVGVVEQVAAEMRKFCNNLSGDIGMSLRRQQDAKARRREQR